MITHKLPDGGELRLASLASKAVYKNPIYIQVEKMLVGHRIRIAYGSKDWHQKFIRNICTHHGRDTGKKFEVRKHKTQRCLLIHRIT